MAVLNRKANKTGRSTGSYASSRDKTRLGPPQGEPWFWLTIQIVESHSFRSLSRAAMLCFFRLMIEHRNHAGIQNGRLPCTYLDFEKYGVRRRSIAPALDELEAVGMIERTRIGRLLPDGASGAPSLYRITMIPSVTDTGLVDATNDWKKFLTINQCNDAIENFRKAALQKRRKLKERKQILRSIQNKYAN